MVSELLLNISHNNIKGIHKMKSSTQQFICYTFIFWALCLPGCSQLDDRSDLNINKEEEIVQHIEKLKEWVNKENWKEERKDLLYQVLRKN